MIFPYSDARDLSTQFEVLGELSLVSAIVDILYENAAFIRVIGSCLATVFI